MLKQRQRERERERERERQRWQKERKKSMNREWVRHGALYLWLVLPLPLTYGAARKHGAATAW